MKKLFILYLLTFSSILQAQTPIIITNSIIDTVRRPFQKAGIPLIADIDKDGQKEIITAAVDYKGVLNPRLLLYVLKSDGTNYSNFPKGYNELIYDIACGDVNGDGYLDIVMLQVEMEFLNYYICKLNGIFEYINEYFLNGNVKAQEFSGNYKDNFSNTSELSFNYKYDLSNRLLETENVNAQQKDDFKLENNYDKDGNISELKRYNGKGLMTDNFNYSYYSSTNKLKRVFGSTPQYTYDANGNMITDEVNRNRDIKYDHRNLITQIRNKKIIFEDSLVYLTYYYYDETGNRVRKKVYQYIGSQTSDSVWSPDIEDIADAPGIWELIKDEIYSRDVDGKELAIYVNGNIKQTNIWGLGMEGQIKSSDEPNFFLKDHLGSIRIVTNENDEVISAQDYDAWGYQLEDREYESEESVYKFTGKERDPESKYDYFGARYYDAKVGRWGQVEPQLSNSPSFSPYNYTSDNPLSRIDPDGLDDYYFTTGSTMQTALRVENSVDRYFIQHDAGNITISGSNSPQSLAGYNFFETASDKTMEIYFESAPTYDPVNVVLDFESEGFLERFYSAIPIAEDYRDNFRYAKEESPDDRAMDKKRFLSKSGLYIFKRKTND